MRNSNKRFWRGCEWGLVATAAMTLAMLLVYAIAPDAMSDPMPLAITTGIIAQVFQLELITPWVIALGLVVQFGYGAIWGGLFAASTREPTVGKGIVVALGLWLLMVIFYIPMAGTLVFSVATSPAMWILTFLFHIVYGATLGYLVQRYPRFLDEAESPA